MSRRVRRLLLLGVAVGGVWVLRRVLTERAEHRTWQPPGAPRLSPGRQAPALAPAPPLSDLDTFRPERPVAAAVSHVDAPAPTSEPVATPPADRVDEVDRPGDAPGPPPPPLPEDESPPGRVEPGNLDRVRERLASIHVDVPPARSGTPGVEGGGGSGGAVRSRRPRRSEPWQEPAPDGTCAPSHPIKVKLRSGLFHLPGMFAYERTKADRCYRTSADAEADGFERAKR
jgi:hypothetical protein